MVRIFAFTDSLDARQILERLTIWSSNGFIEPLYVALGSDDPSTGPVEIVKLPSTGAVTLTLEQTMDTLNEIPMVVQVCLGRESSVTLIGKRTAEEVWQSVLRYADASQKFQKATVLATDSPVTALALDVDDTWSARFFLVPEDRIRPMSPIGHLNSELFASHVASGLISLCGLWSTPNADHSTDVATAAIDQVLSEGQQGDPDMLFLYRSFVRMLQFPTLVTSIIEEASAEFGQQEYPNPDQAQFERTSLAPYISSIADTYVSKFPQIQAGEPALLPPLRNEKNKQKLLQAVRELINQALQQLVLKPAELVDSLLGSYYDRLAERVEGLIPSGNIEVVRWRELGESAKPSSKISEELSQTIDRLPEPDMAPTWIAYRELALGLLDGHQNSGTKLVADQLFLSSANRQMITPYPGEIAQDPLVVASKEATESTTNEAVETVSTAPVVPSLTQAIRQRIETAMTNSSARVEEIKAQRAEEGTDAFEKQLTQEQEESQRIARKITRNVRGTFGGILLSLGLAFYGAFFTHHTVRGLLGYVLVAAIVTGPTLVVTTALRTMYVPTFTVGLVGILALVSNALHTNFRWYLVTLGLLVILLSPLLLALTIWKSAKLQNEYSQRKMERARVRVNEVLEEAHHLSASKKLARRLNEFDDWSAVVGLAAHHPFEFQVNSSIPLSATDLKFPESIAFGTAQISEEDMIRLTGNFRRELFSAGWLNQRFNELRSSVIESLRVKVGAAEELTAAQVEGNTSTDIASPRKLYFSSLNEILSHQGSGPLLARLSSSMQSTSVTDFCDEVTFTSPNGMSERVESINFLESDLEQTGSLLHSHWIPGGKVERAELVSNFRFGNGRAIALTADASSKPPTVIVGTVQMTARIRPDSLNAFPNIKS